MSLEKNIHLINLKKTGWEGGGGGGQIWTYDPVVYQKCIYKREGETLVFCDF